MAEFKAEPGSIIVQTPSSITIDQGGKIRTFPLKEKNSTAEQKKYEELDAPPPVALETESPPEGAP